MTPYASDHFFYLAPIRGVTDALFRTIFHNHFPYFDEAVAPFLNPQRYNNLKDKFLADILPENNKALPVVPQLLYNNSEDFIHLGRKLEDMGYAHLNWNLGCPAPMVANKKRGSGLLPHTDRIVELLKAVSSSLAISISIKTRLGFDNPSDLIRLLPLLEQFPLQEIIIHPRLGKQLYRGSVDLDGFERCLALTNHQLVYNGDIRTADDFKAVSSRFPGIRRWMIGRGGLGDPFLVAEVKGISIDGEERRRKLLAFHTDIHAQLQERLSGPGHLLNRMKQIWLYLIASFPDKEKRLKKILKASNLEKYDIAIAQLFDS